MHIRATTDDDGESIRRVYLSAFPEGECEVVANLAVALLSGRLAPGTLSLVAEIDGVVVGHVAFSRVQIHGDAGCLAFILAPLAVHPGHQARGVGTALVRSGLDRLVAMGAAVVLVYGDPDYYGRFGFDAAAARRYTAPYPLQHPFGWQALALREPAKSGAPASIACVPPLCDPVLW